jgi:uncharacterized membrane protein required for colicin V production
MILSVIVLILIALVAYYHYSQGLFTAAISVGCALIATLVAFGYYENMLNVIGAGKMSDMAAGAMLMLLFGVTYLVLRIVADAVVPGNVSFPLYVERAGAGILGVVAGILSVGTFAVATQLMPFGPAVGMATKYDVADREGIVISNTVFGTINARSKDSGVQNELVNNNFDPANESNLWVPADNLVLSIVKLASAGSFGDAQAFGDVHPDLPLEAFANRIGPDPSTNRVAINTTKLKAVDISGVYTTGPVDAADAELTDSRPGKKPITLPGKPDNVLVLRVDLQDNISDKDGFVRVTPAGVRLVVDGVTYHPAGTMAKAGLISLNRLDDQIPIVMHGKGHGADFAFVLPKSVMSRIIAAGKTKADAGFFELKLFGRVDLGNRPVAAYTGPTEAQQVLSKPLSPAGQMVSPSPKKAD